MKSLAIIPARYASTRFPGKPLALIAGRPMIEWVYNQAKMASFDEVLVATDDARIFNTVKAFGGEALMTSEDHPNGTSRCREVVEQKSDFEWIVNVQGDEPMISKEPLNEILDRLKSGADIVSLYQPIERDQVSSSNHVKVVINQQSHAMYFSRSVIPFPRNTTTEYSFSKHIGVYGFSRACFLEVSKIEPTALAQIESLEQLSWLDHGFSINMIESLGDHRGIDSPEDLVEIQRRIENGLISLPEWF